MTTIIVGSPLKVEFASTHETVEVRDDAGALLGFFEPASKSREEILAQIHASYDPEEIKRRKQEVGGEVTSAELLALLKSLEAGQ